MKEFIRDLSNLKDCDEFIKNIYNNNILYPYINNYVITDNVKYIMHNTKHKIIKFEHDIITFICYSCSNFNEININEIIHLGKIKCDKCAKYVSHKHVQSFLNKRGFDVVQYKRLYHVTDNLRIKCKICNYIMYTRICCMYTLALKVNVKHKKAHASYLAKNKNNENNEIS